MLRVAAYDTAHRQPVVEVHDGVQNLAGQQATGRDEDQGEHQSKYSRAENPGASLIGVSDAKADWRSD